MKWSNAPEEAEWLAMDKGGKWHWFSFSPYIDGERWLYRGGGLYEEADIDDEADDWQTSAETRPQGVSNEASVKRLRMAKDSPVGSEGPIL